MKEKSKRIVEIKNNLININTNPFFPSLLSLFLFIGDYTLDYTSNNRPSSSRNRAGRRPVEKLSS